MPVALCSVLRRSRTVIIARCACFDVRRTRELGACADDIVNTQSPHRGNFVRVVGNMQTHTRQSAHGNVHTESGAQCGKCRE
jgi:hypothetical protein